MGSYVILGHTKAKMSQSFRILARGKGSHCDLGATLDLRAAQPLKNALLRALGKKKSLVLEASSVERLSTACIQLLIAAGTAFKEADLAFSLQNPSATLAESFNDLGLRPVLEEWRLEA